MTKPVVPVEDTPEAEERIELSKLAYFMTLEEFREYIHKLKSA